MDLNVTLNKRIILLSITFLSFFFQAYYINIGYAFKVYMFCIPFLYLFYGFGKINNRFYNYEIFLLLTIISFSFSSLYSYDPESSIRMVVGLLLLCVFYIFYISALKKFNVTDVIFSIFVAGVIFNIISLALYFYGIKSVGGNFSYSTQGAHYGLLVDRGIPRLIGTLKDPNFFIGFNSLFLFISFFNFRYYRISKVLFILSSLTSLFTFSIGGLVAIICGLCSVFIQNKRGLLRFLFLLIAFFGLYFVGKEIFPQLQDFINARASGASDGSGRFKDWINALKTVADYPFGIGIFSFLKYNIEVLGGNHYVHNTYLELLVEGGIHTLILYLMSLLFLLYNVFKLGKLNKNLEFLLPSTISLLMSFFSLSGFASEYWIFYLGIVHFFLNHPKTEKIYYDKN